MTEAIEEKFEEVEKLVKAYRNNEISLETFFERLAEICDEIEGLETIEI